jgi:uncharacterized protein (TIGR03084 family)
MSMAGDEMFAGVLTDLAAEHDDLDGIVAGLTPEGWDTPTPAPGWAVLDQVGHLAFFDARAREALTDPDGFAETVAELQSDPALEEEWMSTHLAEARALAPAELLRWWRAERAGVLAALAATDPARRVPWFGPPMSTVSFATARLMETWAHGQDVADALGVTRLPTARLRHIAHIGVRAVPFSFVVHGLEPPTAPIRVELTSPDHEQWTWGPEDAVDTVRGPALDLCLAVTQRRHPDDLHLLVSGPVATTWISIAQAFAGPPGEGRKPGQFRSV